MSWRPWAVAILSAIFGTLLGLWFALQSVPPGESEPGFAPSAPPSARSSPRSTTGRASSGDREDDALVNGARDSAAVTGLLAKPFAAAPDGADASPRPVDLQAVKSMLESNDLCGLLRSGALGLMGRGMLTELLWEAPGLARYPKNMDDAVSAVLTAPEAGGVLADSRFTAVTSSELLDFWNALLLGEMISGVKPAHVDLAESLRLLERFARSSPANGAFSYFLANIRSKLGQDRRLVKAEFLRAFNRSRYFDSYHTYLNRRVMERGFQNAAYYMAGVAVYARTPIADYLQPHALVREFIEEGDAEFNRAAIRFARILMNPALRNKGVQQEIFWLPLDYAIGQTMCKLVSRKRNPGQDYPEECRKDYKEFIDQKKSKEWNEAMDEVESSKPGECQRARVDKLVAAEKEVYLKFLRKQAQTKAPRAK